MSRSKKPQPSGPQRQLMVLGLDRPQRLDRVLRQRFPQSTRRDIEALINGGKVTVNGRPVWLCSWQVKNGDKLELQVAPRVKPPQASVFADTWLIAQHEDLIAVNKPAGLLAEPTRWTDAPNLLDLAQDRFGPVTLFHRLDRDTSGVMLLTRPGPINRYLDDAFKAGTVTKTYLAVAQKPNRLGTEGVIDVPMTAHPTRRDMMIIADHGGKPARTRYLVFQETADHQWLHLWPETGRTHQLRVHLASLDAPILGDRLYNPRWRQAKRLMLHAEEIVLPVSEPHPRRVFRAPLPADFMHPPTKR